MKTASKKAPSRKEDEEEMLVMPPMPIPPPPQPPEMPLSTEAPEGPEPPSEGPGPTEALNNEKGVAIPIPDVPDTHNNDIGGDTGQGVPQVQQGPGL